MRNFKNKNRNKIVGGAAHGDPKGITLIALVFTIIILIILAGVAINLTINENGIFEKAKNAKELYVNESEKEKLELNNIPDEIEDLVSPRTVRAIANNKNISRGTNQNVSEYFKIKTSEEIESIKYYNVTQEETVEIENTKELLSGEYTIKCVATKKDKTEESATIKLTVKGIVYISGTVNVDEYLDEEVTIKGNSDDATVITGNASYFLPGNNITFENVKINANAISVNTANLIIKFKSCRLNLTGYNPSNIKAGITSNKNAGGSKLYFENCVFETENSRKFDSWAENTVTAYIKNDCTPSNISDFTKCVTSTGRAEWQLVVY